MIQLNDGCVFEQLFGRAKFPNPHIANRTIPLTS
jgi:hypothetical protein